MTPRTASLILGAVLMLAALMLPSTAPAAPPPGGTPGNPSPTAQDNQTDSGSKDDKCKVAGVPVPTGIGQKACRKAGDVAGAVTGVPGQVAGDVAGAAAGSVFDQLTKWITDGASWLTGQISKAIDTTTTPELDAGWYRARFASMAALGLGLALLVAMVALASAALRRDPEALGATLIGMFRAGLGTGLVLALTVMGLALADGVTSSIAQDAVGKDAAAFWSSVGGAWRKIGDGAGDAAQATTGSPAVGQATGSVAADKAAPPAAVAFFFALVSVIAGFAVWVELLLRSAAIYVAVLFMPVALAAGIWPSLRSWQSKLTRALFVLIAMKPVVVTVLALAGSAATSALAGQARNGVGVLLAAVVIFALAAWAPWALLHLISIDHEGHWTSRGGIDGARGAALAGGGQLGGAARMGARSPSPSGQKMGGGGNGGGTRGGAGRGGSGGGGPSAATASAAGPGSAGGAVAAPAGAATAAGGAGGGVALGAVGTAAGLWKGGKWVGGQAGETAAAASGESSSSGAQGAAGAAHAPQRAPGLSETSSQVGGAAGGRSQAPTPRPGQGSPGAGAGGERGGSGGRSQAPSPRTGQRPGGGRGAQPKRGGGS